MTTCFNKMFTTKLDNPEFASKILAFRRAYEDEIERLVDYRSNGIISTQCLMERTDRTIKHYDNMFIKEFEQLEIGEKIRLIATWKEFNDFAEQGLFHDSEILLSAARLVK